MKDKYYKSIPANASYEFATLNAHPRIGKITNNQMENSRVYSLSI